MDQAFFVTAFATLFVVINPLGLVTFFMALTRGLGAPARRRIAARGSLIAAGLLAAFAFMGEALLNFIGISLPAFRIAGGLLLFLTALQMLFDRRARTEDGGDDLGAHDPSVFPLATPLIAGPGAIASMILLVTQAGAGLAGALAVTGLMLALVALTFAALLLAPYLERLLGPTGSNVITRLLGMLLAALSVQFVLDGLHGAGLT